MGNMDEVMNGDVLLVYSISSCEACKKELQLFSQLSESGKSQTKVFAVMYEDERVVKDYVKQYNLRIPILIDKNAKLLQGLDIKYFPCNLKLSNGIIKEAVFGLPRDQETLLALIKDR